LAEVDQVTKKTQAGWLITATFATCTACAVVIFGMKAHSRLNQNWFPKEFDARSALHAHAHQNRDGSLSKPPSLAGLTAVSIVANTANHDTFEPSANAKDGAPDFEFPANANHLNHGICPDDMASIDNRFCVDIYEASLVEIMPNGHEEAWPYTMPVSGHVVRAVSEKSAFPQAYISEKEALLACHHSGKRLCKSAEWAKACQGPENTRFGYGNERKPGLCNDNGRSPVLFYYAATTTPVTGWTWDKLNDPQLNQLERTLSETGSHEGCTNGYGVYDMVGNLHEWVDDPAGTFQGGYYLDVTQNGEGCSYRTSAHDAAYHDYSTGFRCCADISQ
jgi:hypothetical protein